MRDGMMRGAVGRGGGKDVPVVGARHLARHRAKHTICNQKQNTGENRGTQALRVRCVGKVSRPTGGSTSMKQGPPRYPREGDTVAQVSLSTTSEVRGGAPIIWAWRAHSKPSSTYHEWRVEHTERECEVVVVTLGLWWLLHF